MCKFNIKFFKEDHFFIVEEKVKDWLCDSISSLFKTTVTLLKDDNIVLITTNHSWDSLDTCEDSKDLMFIRVNMDKLPNGKPFIFPWSAYGSSNQIESLAKFLKSLYPVTLVNHDDSDYTNIQIELFTIDPVKTCVRFKQNWREYV